MKAYRGSPAAARCYVEADRSRADDYYLAEGTGVAQRHVAAPDTGVRTVSPLAGEGYEAWVAGVDPDTGVPRGRLRQDGHGVRFVEVVVNGPKSWSLAAALHDDVSGALDAAQDQAAGQIIGWLAQHATTRVGPRGGQVQVPVAGLEAAVIRHCTSRAGDPHRHLHLQVNARVLAAGEWRGLHTVGVRDSLGAINGIGHAAVMTDPRFRASLAAHGYELDRAGEIVQLAPHVGAFSRRAAQIARSIDRYDSEWTAAHPGHQAGPALRRSWDARAWAEDRPDKIVPRSAAELHQRWLGELAALGYRDSDTPTRLDATLVGRLDRDHGVDIVLSRLASGRSAWNAADVRGEVEQLIARAGIVTDAAVRLELAEDLTARTLTRCVPLLDAADRARAVPEHVRALTSPRVLQVEADLVARLAARDDATPVLPRSTGLAVPAQESVAGAGRPSDRSLDSCQAAGVTVLTSARRLVVVEGAAGAGKTSVLAATRDQLAAQGRRVRVVTPTLKAAQVASRQTGATSGSAAGLAYQHGWRWDEHGAWTRLRRGDLDPVTGDLYRGPRPDAVLDRGDLLVVDEAGMLDQDTARALLTVADEAGVRVAVLGDRRQLTAVGRGGVLDLAARWVAPEARVDLSEVHRFTRQVETGPGVTVTVADDRYAQLSLAMRAGDEPGEVFDALLDRGQVAVHPSTWAQVDAVAEDYAAARDPGQVAVVADTREQADELNTVLRERLVAAGRVDDAHVVTTMAGVRVGVGDRVATRRNNAGLGVANRDTWTVTRVAADGGLQVSDRDGRRRALPAGYVHAHVELAYASTVYGVQGDTVAAAHMVIGDRTGAAAAYVGMTRGRQANTAHLAADSIDEARERWIEVFARDRADLGPTHSRQHAARRIADYATPRPVEHVLAELRHAWTSEARDLERLEHHRPIRDALREIVALRQSHDVELAALEQRHRQTRDDADHATARVEASTAVMDRQTEQLRGHLLRAWHEQRGAAAQAARTVLAGPGRLGLRLRAVNRAAEHLACWSVTWQPHLPDMPVDTRGIAHYADRHHDPNRLHAVFDDYAREQVTRAHPEHADLHRAAAAAAGRRDQAWRDHRDATRTHERQLSRHGSLGHTDNPGQHLREVDGIVTDLDTRLADTRHAIARLTTDPAIAALPAGKLTHQHDLWRAGHGAHRHAEHHAAMPHAARLGDEPSPLSRHDHHHDMHTAIDHDRDHGPSIGR